MRIEGRIIYINLCLKFKPNAFAELLIFGLIDFISLNKLANKIGKVTKKLITYGTVFQGRAINKIRIIATVGADLITVINGLRISSKFLKRKAIAAKRIAAAIAIKNEANCKKTVAKTARINFCVVKSSNALTKVCHGVRIIEDSKETTLFSQIKPAIIQINKRIKTPKNSKLIRFLEFCEKCVNF